VCGAVPCIRHSNAASTANCCGQPALSAVSPTSTRSRSPGSRGGTGTGPSIPTHVFSLRTAIYEFLENQEGSPGEDATR
jgi:hypothetical protein